MIIKNVIKPILLVAFLLATQSSVVLAETNLFAGIIEPEQNTTIRHREPYIRVRAKTSRFVKGPCCKVRLNYRNNFVENGESWNEWVVVREESISEEMLDQGKLFEIAPLIYDILGFNNEYSDQTFHSNEALLTTDGEDKRRNPRTKWIIEVLTDDDTDNVLVSHEFYVQSRSITEEYPDYAWGDANGYEQGSGNEDGSGSHNAFPKVPVLPAGSGGNGERRRADKIKKDHVRNLVGKFEINIVSPKTNTRINEYSIPLQARIPQGLPDNQCCEVFLIHQATVNTEASTNTEWNIIQKERYTKESLVQGVNIQWMGAYEKARKKYAGNARYETQNLKFKARKAGIWSLVVNPLPSSEIKSDQVVIVLEPPYTVPYD